MLQSLMEAFTNRLEELTKDAPQKPESWAMNTKLRSDVRKKDGDKEHRYFYLISNIRLNN